MVCAHADCSLRVYAAMNRDRGMVEVITANPNHIFVGAVMRHRSATNRQAWLQRILRNTYSHEENHTIGDHRCCKASPSGANYICCSKMRQVPHG